MRQSVLGIGRRAVIVVGLGGVLVSMSEFWFYEIEEGVDSILILLAYGVLGYLFIAVLQRFHVHSVAGLVVAAALLGFLIEGVPVAVVYSNPPLSIIWTSLAWHAFFTIGLGWLWTRVTLAAKQSWRIIALQSGLGITLGAWNAFMWNAHEVAGAREFVFRWQPVDVFAIQFLHGYAMFIGGHILLDRLHPKTLNVSQREHIGLWALMAALSLLVAYGSGLLLFYPVLPALVVVCLLALRREAHAYAQSAGTILDRVYEQRIPVWRFCFTLMIPVWAIPTYAVLTSWEVELEMNAFLILTAGPATLAAFLWALVKIGMRAQKS